MPELPPAPSRRPDAAARTHHPVPLLVAAIACLLMAAAAMPANAQPVDDDGDGWSNSDELACQYDDQDPTSFPFDLDLDAFCDFERLSGAAPDTTSFGGLGWQLLAPTADIRIDTVPGSTYEPTNFGGGGTVVPFADGRTLLLAPSLSHDISVYRLLADGTRDPSFGLGGAQFLPVPFEEIRPILVVQSTGNLVVVASHRNGVLSVHRLAPDGTKTAPFASGASSIIVRGPPAEFLWQLEVDQSDRLLLTTDVGLLRLTSDGALDTGFGQNGLVACGVCRFALLADQRIMLADANAGMRFWRLTADGAVDPSFGVGGAVEIPDATGLSTGSPAALVRQGSALYLAASFFGAFPFTPALARFDVDGALDTSFGTNGWRVIGVPELTSPSLLATDLVVLSDGTAYPLVRDTGALHYVVRIDALGDQDAAFDGDGAFAPPFNFIADIEASNDLVTVSGFGEPGSVPGSPTGPGGIEVRRYSSTFSPDPAFAAGGGFTQYNNSFSASLLAGLQTGGGQLLVAGTAGFDDQLPDVDGVLATRPLETAVFGRACLLARFTSAGLPDASFGNEGVVHVAPNNDCLLADVIERQSGGYVAVGVTGAVFLASTAFAMAVDENGALDATFGAGQGYVTSSSVPAWTRVAELSDGSLVVAGETTLQKLSAAGVLDPAFGGPGGIASFPAAESFDLAVQQTDRIIAYSPAEGLVRGLQPFGLSDTSFGAIGQVALTPLTLRLSLGSWMAIGPDDRIVVATNRGPSSPPGAFDLHRLLPDGSPDPSFDARVAPAGIRTLADVTSLRPLDVTTVYGALPGFGFNLGSLHADADGYLSGTATAPLTPGAFPTEIDTFVFRLDPFGRPVADFSDSLATSPPEWVQLVLPDNDLVFSSFVGPDHGLFLAGEHRSESKVAGALVKLQGEGDLDGDGLIARDDPDDDGDGIPDGADNCRRTPNGPASLTCWDPMLGPGNGPCTTSADCASGEYCVGSQVDLDGNGRGTVCDPIEVPEPGLPLGLLVGCLPLSTAYAARRG